MELYATVDSPNEWAIVDGVQGRMISRGVANSLGEIEFPEPVDRFVLVVRGSKVATHRVNIPGKSRKNAIAAIPYMLEDELTNDIEDLHFSLLGWNPGSGSEVLVVEKALMHDWMASAAATGVEVDDIVPEYLMLPRHPSADITVARNASGTWVIRSGANSGTVADEDMLELWWETLPGESVIAVNDKDMARRMLAGGRENVQFWDIGDSIADWAAHGGGRDIAGPCLLQGEFNNREESQTRMDYRLAVNLVLAGIIVYIGALLSNQAWLGYKTSQLQDKAEELYQVAFPDTGEKQVDDPVFEMRKSISALSSGNYQSGNFLPLYQVLASEINSSGNVRLVNLVFEDNALKARVNVADFSALDTMSRNLANATRGYAEVDIAEAVAQDNDVEGVVEIGMIRG